MISWKRLQRSRVLSLQEIQRAQIFTRLIEAAAAERSHKLAALRDFFRADFPFAPRESIVGETERGAIFILQHFRDLGFAPRMDGRKNASPENVEKAVHLRL